MGYFLLIASHNCDGPVDYCSCLDSHSDGTHSGSTGEQVV